METRVYLLPIAAVLGLVAGVGAGKFGGDPVAAAAPGPPAAAATPAKRGGSAANGRSAADAKITVVKPGPLPRSTDTVETLLQLDRGPLYARLGLWLLDASEEDMTAFWEGY